MPYQAPSSDGSDSEILLTTRGGGGAHAASTSSPPSGSSSSITSSTKRILVAFTFLFIGALGAFVAIRSATNYDEYNSSETPTEINLNIPNNLQEVEPSSSSESDSPSESLNDIHIALKSVSPYGYEVDESFTRLGMTGSGYGWRSSAGQDYIYIQNMSTPFNLVYDNQLDDYELIHLHGLTPVYTDDGVPYISRAPIQSGKNLKVSFDLSNATQFGNIGSGTYFLHSHYFFHHDQGMSLPFIINAPIPQLYPLRTQLVDAEDIVVFIEDECPYAAVDSRPDKCIPPVHAFKTLHSRWHDRADKGFNHTMCRPAGNSTDIHYLHHLVNGRTLDHPRYQRVLTNKYYRLRVINSGGMSNYLIDLGELTGHVVAVDGQWIHPLENLNQIFIATAQRLDILVQIPEISNQKYAHFPILAREDGAHPHKGQAGLILYTSDNDDDQYIPKIEPLSTFANKAAGDMGLIGHEQEWKFSAFEPLENKKVDREITVQLTGNNGFHSIDTRNYLLPPMIKVSDFAPNDHPILVKNGERVCITMVNHNSTPHPMHMHGARFQVVEIGGKTIEGAMRDTVLVPRGNCNAVKICFDAVNPGIHPLHCHMQYHMMAGMFTTIEYIE